MKKNKQYRLVLLTVNRIGGINKYSKIFLGTMLLRKIRHPEEGLRVIVKKTMKTMGKRYSHYPQKDKDDEMMRQISIQALDQTEETYGKTDLVDVGVDKCLYDLESALEHARLPEDCILDGETVSSVFKYLKKEVKIFLMIGNIRDIDDDEITFIADLYKQSKLDPNANINTIVMRLMEKNGELTSVAEEDKEKVVKQKIENLETIRLPKEWKIEGDDVLSGILLHLKEETSE